MCIVLQSIQLARTHELKPYIIFIKPSSMSGMKQSRKNARMITDYYVNMKFKVRFQKGGKKSVRFVWISATPFMFSCFLMRKEVLKSFK